jgi:hypothetical protein
MRDARIGHAERTEVVALLNGAYDAGLLPVETFDERVAAVGSATYASELRAQLGGLPSAYAWAPPAPQAPPTAAGRVALILGIASVPFSFCLIGGVLGLLAVIASRRGGPAGSRVTAALVGRVFGIVGMVLSLGAAFALVYARSHPTGP